jgi:hypothetical protein
MENILYNRLSLRVQNNLKNNHKSCNNHSIALSKVPLCAIAIVINEADTSHVVWWDHLLE